MNFRLLLYFTCTAISLPSWSQSTNFDVAEPHAHWVRRWETLSGNVTEKFHSGHRPFAQDKVIGMIDELEDQLPTQFSKIDQANMRWIQSMAWEYLSPEKKWIAFSQTVGPKEIYRRKADFLSAEKPDFIIKASPIFHFQGGIERLEGIQNSSAFINTRGAEVRALVNQKLGFYSRFTENQQTNWEQTRSYIQQFNGTPYLGFVKFLGGDTLRRGSDFIDARGYIAFRPIKNLELSFGHDKNFIGHGIRSMILSDFSAPYLQLRSTIDLGKIKYASIFAQLSNAQIPRGPNGEQPIPPKYMTFHRLSAQITRQFQLAFSEMVIFGNRPIGFDLNYLNPVIFYRFVEGFLGSPDNVMVSADFRWNIKKRFTLHGQFVLDELKISEFKADGWWAKKFAYQVGGIYYNVFGLENVDLQVEYNRARPYMYSHFSTFSNAVHYNLPLAHPLGANFGEWVGKITAQPTPKLFFELTGMAFQRGIDNGLPNWGGNILRLNGSFRVQDFGNNVGQGVPEKVRMIQSKLSYQLKTNAFLDLTYAYRNRQLPAVFEKYPAHYIALGVRLNAWRGPDLY